ncbi:MAG: class II aldolase/adducin family protein [Chlorobiota bacterium]
MPMYASEGTVKFEYQWERIPLPESPQLRELCRWRNLLFRYGLIGADSAGVGYGNVSIRYGEGARFLITGNGTGRIAELTAEGCSEVMEVDIHRNFLRCRGLVRASSESLSHAALYLSSPAIGAVVHVHHRTLWERLFGVCPTTDPAIPYGTPELALALMRLVVEHRLERRGLIVMGGHKDGLLSFGSTLQEAVQILLQRLTELPTPVPSVPECSEHPGHLPPGSPVPCPQDSAH